MKSLKELIREQVVVAAEIGINHNGEYSIAEELVDAAAQCGADAVKFQSFNTDYMYSRLTPGFSHTEKDVFAQMKELEVKAEWWEKLKAYAHKRGVLFAVSVFDKPSLDIVSRTGIDFVKVASGELTNLPLLKDQLLLSDTFVVSTGMAVYEEIQKTVTFLDEIGVSHQILLECTSAYPAPPESVNLLNIDFLRERFSLPVGFSDHTVGVHHAMAAVARGACFIEKHFTLDKNSEGPDHILSSDPEELKALVDGVRDLEKSLKTNEKKGISIYEEAGRELGRKSVVASKLIPAGEEITKENTLIKRPGKGISPVEASELYGKVALTDIPGEQWITWDMVKR